MWGNVTSPTTHKPGYATCKLALGLLSHAELLYLVRMHKIAYLMTCTTISNKHARSKYYVK
jgi:hypothetical protein